MSWSLKAFNAECIPAVESTSRSFQVCPLVLFSAVRSRNCSCRCLVGQSRLEFLASNIKIIEENTENAVGINFFRQWPQHSFWEKGRKKMKKVPSGKTHSQAMVTDNVTTTYNVLSTSKRGTWAVTIVTKSYSSMPQQSQSCATMQKHVQYLEPPARKPGLREEVKTFKTTNILKFMMSISMIYNIL